MISLTMKKRKNRAPVSFAPHQQWGNFDSTGTVNLAKLTNNVETVQRDNSNGSISVQPYLVNPGPYPYGNYAGGVWG